MLSGYFMALYWDAAGAERSIPVEAALRPGSCHLRPGFLLIPQPLRQNFGNFRSVPTEQPFHIQHSATSAELSTSRLHQPASELYFLPNWLNHCDQIRFRN